MLGQTLAPGLSTWECYHPEWKQVVRSAAYEAGRTLVLLDPLLPAGRARARAWRALDAAVEEGRALHVLVTIFFHERSTPEIVERYGRKARVVWPGKQDRPYPTRPYEEARLPAGIRAFGTTRGPEVVLYIPRIRTIHAGDVLLGGTRRPLRVCPQGWISRPRADLARSMRPLRELPLDRVHVSHGAPVVADARATLRRALDEAEGR